MTEFLESVDLAEWLENIEFWHWWVLAVLLVAVEVLAPSTVLLWPGIAAVIVGIVLLAGAGIGWQMQVLIFAFLSVTSLVGWRAYSRTRPLRTDDANLNRRGQQCVGRTYILEEPIVNGRGKLKAEGTIWTIAGDDLAAGARVKVVEMDGAIFRVEEA